MALIEILKYNFKEILTAEGSPREAGIARGKSGLSLTKDMIATKTTGLYPDAMNRVSPNIPEIDNQRIFTPGTPGLN